jgi:hypothetical protein
MTASQSQAEAVPSEDPAVVGGEAHGELYPNDAGPGMYEYGFVPVAIGLGLVFGLVTIAVLLLRRSMRRRG